MPRPHPASLVLLAALAVGCHRADPETAAMTPSPKGTKPRRVVRLPVMHGQDEGAAKIDRTPKETTISEMLAQTLPADYGTEKYVGKRVAPFETQVWRVEANVKSVVHRKDGDFYLVLEDPNGKGETVVEVPDPKKCEGSPLLADITKAREDLEKRFHPGDKEQPIGKKATIDGVGFLGFRGTPGGPANGARLMPGLGFKWK